MNSKKWKIQKEKFTKTAHLKINHLGDKRTISSPLSLCCWDTGHVLIDGVKMSKSLGNGISIADALETSSPNDLRMLCLLRRFSDRWSERDTHLDVIFPLEGVEISLFDPMWTALLPRLPLSLFPLLLSYALCLVIRSMAIYYRAAFNIAVRLCLKPRATSSASLLFFLLPLHLPTRWYISCYYVPAIFFFLQKES